MTFDQGHESNETVMAGIVFKIAVIPGAPLTAITTERAGMARLDFAPSLVRESVVALTHSPSRVRSDTISRGTGPPYKRESPCGRGELPRTMSEISPSLATGQDLLLVKTSPNNLAQNSRVAVSIVAFVSERYLPSDFSLTQHIDDALLFGKCGEWYF